MPIVHRSVKVRIPATTANLGPGFDCLGLSLQIYNSIVFEEADNPGLEIVSSGPSAPDDLPLDERNLVYRSADRIFGILDSRPAGLRISLEINAPLGRGLGSSASAIVGGMAAANMMCGEALSPAELVLEMARAEGHPDNVVPAYVGGLTASLMLDDKVLFHRIEPASNLQCVLLIPGYELATQKARAALPQKVPFKDAVFNLCRVPLVLANLAAGNLEDLSTLMDDRLHQPYRKELVREFDVIATEAENAGAAAVCLSGAGPTMLAIADKLRATAVANAMAAVLEPIDPACTSLIVTPDLDGCVIEIPGVNPANKS